MTTTRTKSTVLPFNHYHKRHHRNVLKAQLRSIAIILILVLPVLLHVLLVPLLSPRREVRVHGEAAADLVNLLPVRRPTTEYPHGEVVANDERPGLPLLRVPTLRFLECPCAMLPLINIGGYSHLLLLLTALPNRRVERRLLRKRPFLLALPWRTLVRPMEDCGHGSITSPCTMPVRPLCRPVCRRLPSTIVSPIASP